MEHAVLKQIKRARRKSRIRKRVLGGPDRPRLTVFRSARHIYAQIVDDLAGRTLVAASTVGKTGVSGGKKSDDAKGVGTSIAEKARSAGIQTVVFDRNGFRYHGRIKALADAAREAGLKF